MSRLSPLLLLAFVFSAAADPQSGGRAERGAQGRDRAPGHQADRDRRSLAESVRRVERATGGQILSAERVPFDGRDMNRIKVVDATGRVRVITEDPQRRGRPQDD